MGQFVNPGNENFEKEIHSAVYVDKTGLLEFTNRVMNTTDEFVLNSRPRRFGKSYTADMLTAYYSKGCDSESLFAGLQISHSPDYRKHLNQYDVIRFDVQWFQSAASTVEEDVVTYINRVILEEMRKEYQKTDLSNVAAVFTAMSKINAETGKRFVVIIDEWDCLIRDHNSDSGVSKKYIRFLRGMFKGIEPTNYIALAYMTGILPIKRQQTQSALNNFREYTMISPKVLAPYIGFTDEEVKGLCRHYHADYQEIRRWYDGYLLAGWQVYNPMAVSDSVQYGVSGNSWINTSSFLSIKPYINLNFDGLKTDLMSLIAGNRVRVNTGTFENYTDRNAFKSKDDVLTYLIHLGYLGYDTGSNTAFVPNEEIRLLLGTELANSKWTEYTKFSKTSMDILTATIEQDGEKVVHMVEEINDRYASSIWYNNENSLAACINIAYLATFQYYFKPFREMPTGKGFADVVYLPRPENIGNVPALLVELKWNKDVSTAINQIREKEYPSYIKEYTGDILLVGISYDKKTKKHFCEIEELSK